LLACALLASPTLSQPAPPPLTDWARQLYEREVARQNNPPQNGPDRGRDPEQFYRLFTPETRRLVQTGTLPSTMPDGPILNAFFGWGVLPRHEVKLGAVRAAKGKGDAEAVDIEYWLRGEQRSLRLYAVRVGAEWQIEDIAYDRGEAYAAFHRRLVRR
jgi:hypothetical protein